MQNARKKETLMKKLLLIVTCLSFTLCASATPSPASAADDILINDFEVASYGDWKAEGEAFGAAPAKGTLGGQMEVTGFAGD
jgi:fructan beta-fructosidase